VRGFTWVIIRGSARPYGESRLESPERLRHSRIRTRILKTQQLPMLCDAVRVMRIKGPVAPIFGIAPQILPSERRTIQQQYVEIGRARAPGAVANGHHFPLSTFGLLLRAPLLLQLRNAAMGALQDIALG
jgi:hypothetical protein